MDPCATTLQNKSTNQPKTGAPAPSILYLCKSDLIKLGGCSNQLYIDAVTEGLALHSAGEVVQPLKPYLRWPVAPHIADRIIAMPGFLGGESPIAGIKWVGSREANSKKYGLPRASALIILNDSDTNYPVAIMEGGLISGMRTAAITAVATKYLAKRDFSRVSCVGCGPIAEMHLRTLLEQFPSIQIIHLFDINTGAAFNLQLAIQSEHPTVDVIVEQSARAAVESAEVLVTCTVTDKPYIEYSWLKPGVFISNVSIMDVHKEVYERADKVVVDDWDQSN
ncbi:MAG: 2,3-diaminopropionate biosynthesis protein SbnB, partial [Exilibacterium sp.]